MARISDSRRPLRVSWLMRTPLAPYRVPVLERLGQDPRLKLTVFHGGQSAPEPYGEIDIGRSVGLVSLRNVHWPGGGHRVAFQLGINRLFRQKTDVVIVPDITHSLTTWVTLVVSRLQGRRVVAFGYGTRPSGVTPGWAKRLRDLGRRIFMALANVAATYTDEGALGVAELGMRPESIVSIGNTLDVEYLRSLSDPAAAVAKRRELGVDGPVLLFVGRLQQPKRIDLLVDSFELVRRSMSDASLVIIGSGEVGGTIPATPGIHHLPDIYDPRLLAPYFELADLLVIPGRIGLTCVHAFAYGLPVVTCHRDLVEQSPEYVYLADGVNSAIVRSATPTAVSGAILDLVGDAERLAALSLGAAETAAGLGMDHMADQIAHAVLLAAAGDDAGSQLRPPAGTG